VRHKILLTDIDGVVLDWQKHFNKYLDHYYPGEELFDPTVFAQGERTGKIIKEFNNSAWIGFLEPWKDSVEVLTELNHMGWKIYGCTSMGTDQYANALRKKNIETLMPDVFAQLEIIPFMQPKGNWLAPWKGSGAVWVEDKWSNAIIGADMGIKTFLMKQSYNSKQDYQGVEKVDNWRQIYNKVIS
tara:strand:+ start:833 stop:1390 length:558 start_codon:yes stop_codon:yes gene_type:complete